MNVVFDKSTRTRSSDPMSWWDTASCRTVRTHQMHTHRNQTVCCICHSRKAADTAGYNPRHKNLKHEQTDDKTISLLMLGSGCLFILAVQKENFVRHKIEAHPEDSRPHSAVRAHRVDRYTRRSPGHTSHRSHTHRCCCTLLRTCPEGSVDN